MVDAPGLTRDDAIIHRRVELRIVAGLATVETVVSCQARYASVAKTVATNVSGPFEIR